MPGKVKTITLILTQSCNLSCSYCYEDNKDSKGMVFSVAKEIIDRELKDERFGEFIIDFFGGEPLLKFPLIQECMEYLQANYKDKKIIYAMTTNGVLARGHIKEWLKEHKDIMRVTLSYDGTPQMQDINRCNSSSLIDVEFFHENWPFVPMKMTISPETLPYLAEGIIYMHEHNYAFTANLAYDIDWSNKDNESVLERELMKLINYYLEHPDTVPCQLFQYNFDRVPVKIEKNTQLRCCGAGVEMVTYNSEGKAYPCQFFTPLSVGEEKAKRAESFVFKDTVTVEDFPEPCRSCKVVMICQTCYGANYSQSDNIFKKDPNICKLNKILFKAAAYLWLEKYKKGQIKRDKKEHPQILKAVKIILDELE